MTKAFLNEKQSVEELFAVAQPRRGEPLTFVVSSHDLLNGFEDGLIQQYQFNRGKGIVNRKVLESYLTNGIQPTGFGVIHLGVFADSFDTADGNSRLWALSEYKKMGKTIPHFSVTLQLCHEDDFLTVYQYANSGKTHTGQNMILNPELLGGKITQRILKRANITIPANFQQNFLDVIIANIDAHLNGEPAADLADVYAIRNFVKEGILNVRADKVIYTIPKDIMERAVDALTWYKHFKQEIAQKIESVEEKNPEADTLYERKIYDSNGLFFYFMVDFFQPKPQIINQTPKYVADRAFNNAKKVHIYAKTIARRTTGELKVKDLVRTLTKRVTKKARPKLKSVEGF